MGKYVLSALVGEDPQKFFCKKVTEKGFIFGHCQPEQVVLFSSESEAWDTLADNVRIIPDVRALDVYNIEDERFGKFFIKQIKQFCSNT